MPTVSKRDVGNSRYCKMHRINLGKTMQIQLHAETDIELSRLHEPDFDVSSDDPEQHFSATAMFATSLAMCTFAVLAAYGERAGAGVENLTMRLRWRYGEKPHRIEHVSMDVRWPELPESRLDAAMRAAATCTLHRTLEHSVEVDTMIDN